MTQNERSIANVFVLWLILVFGCTSPRKESQPAKSPNSSGEALPVTASAYETIEPLATERISTTKLNDRYARRTFKDPQNPENWHELIIGTGNDSEKVFAYFHFLPISTVEYAERDEREFRWGLLLGKYAFLTNIPITSLKGDLELAKECKDSAAFFYLDLHKPRAVGEGIDIRGIHLAVKPYKGKTAVIVGLTSDKWNEIRRKIMRGEKDELYSLFP